MRKRQLREKRQIIYLSILNLFEITSYKVRIVVHKLSIATNKIIIARYKLAI